MKIISEETLNEFRGSRPCEFCGHTEPCEPHHMFGWRVAHFRAGRTVDGWRTAVQGDGRGFPDLIMLKGQRIIAAELKRSRQAKVTPEQEAWLAAFLAAGLEAYVWTPDDWDLLKKTLEDA